VGGHAAATCPPGRGSRCQAHGGWLTGTGLRYRCRTVHRTHLEGPSGRVDPCDLRMQFIQKPVSPFHFSQVQWGFYRKPPHIDLAACWSCGTISSANLGNNHFQFDWCDGHSSPSALAGTKEVCRQSMSDGFRATPIVIVSGPLERDRTPPCDLLSSPLRPSVSRSVEFLQCTCSGHIDLIYACLGIPHLQEYLSSCRHPVPIVAHPHVPLPATPRLPATPPLQLVCTVHLSGRPHRPP